MQTIRIILSASKTLQQERMELADLVENLNHSLESRDANILMLVWDGSETTLGTFKENISDKDLCLTLYYDTFDDSTQSELETAYQSLCEGKNPKKIYVYFKDNENVSEKLQAFRDSFPTKYGHFYCSFSNIDTLKADFLLQFMEYQSKNLGSSKMLEVNNGKVTIDGNQYVDLKNVPFAGNNDEYNLLLKSIKKTQKLLAITEEDDPDYADYAADLQEMKEKLSKMESSLWDTALMITRLSTTKCSERLKRAMDLFTAGDNKGAQAVLNEEEIERDVEHNLHLIQLGEEGKKGLKVNIEEYQLKIKTLENEMSEGWIQQIIEIRKNVIELSKKAYGENSEHTADAYYNLGNDLTLGGFFKESLESHLISLEMRQEILGRNHIKIINSNTSIADVYNELWEHDKTIEYLKNALEISYEVFGERHNEIIKIYIEIGYAYFSQRKYQEALKYHKKALKISLALNGEMCHETSSAYNDISLSLNKLGNYEEALEYQIKANKILLKLYGESHPFIPTAYDNLGCIYSKLHQYDKALEFQKKAIELNLHIFGEKHYETARLYVNIAETYVAMDLYNRALDCLKKALEIRIRVLGNKSSQVALLYNRIGCICSGLSMNEEALQYFHKSLEYCIEVLGNNHPRTALSYENLGYVYEDLNMYEEALNCFNKDLDIQFLIAKEENLPNGPAPTFKLADLCHEIGTILFSIDDYENAERMLNNAVNIMSDVDDADPILGEWYSLLGMIYGNMGEHDKALKCFQDSLNRKLSEYGEDNVEISQAYERLGNAHAALGEKDLALDAFHKSLEILLKCSSNDVENIERVQQLIKEQS